MMVLGTMCLLGGATVGFLVGWEFGERREEKLQEKLKEIGEVYDRTC